MHSVYAMTPGLGVPAKVVKKVGATVPSSHTAEPASLLLLLCLAQCRHLWVGDASAQGKRGPTAFLTPPASHTGQAGRF